MTALMRPTVMISSVDASRRSRRPPTPNRMLSTGEPVHPTASAMQTVDMPTTAPTEISSPPEMMTIVCAVARMPRMAIAWPILRMLRKRKKTSGRRLPKIAIRTASAISRLKLCVPDRAGSCAPRPERAAALIGRGGRSLHLQVRHCAPAFRFGSGSPPSRGSRMRSSVASSRGEFGDDAPAGHHEDPVSQSEEFRHFRGDHQERDSLPRRARRSDDRSRPWRRHRCRAWARPGSALSAGARASGQARPSADCRPKGWRPAPSRFGVLMRSRSTSARRDPALGAVVDEIQPADEVGDRERDVVLDAAQEQQRLRLPILGREAYPRRDRVGGAAQIEPSGRPRRPCPQASDHGRRSPRPIPSGRRRSGRRGRRLRPNGRRN